MATTLPDLGRSAHIVGDVENVLARENPHSKVERGEVGDALRNWRKNRVSKDALKRVASNGAGADKRNTFSHALDRLPMGGVNPQRMPVEDPLAMTHHLKRVALHFGADLVGVGAAHPSFFYAEGRILGNAIVDDPDIGTAEELVRRYPYFIAVPVALDYDLVQAHRHDLGDLAYGFADQKIALLLSQLERYIGELGYHAIQGALVPQAASVAAGLGELGRNGLLITKEFGARVVLSAIISTDLPLVPDKPIDIGVEDFCKVCRKCAQTCPTNSIPFGDKVIFNGVEKYKINWESCYKLRPYVRDHWSVCLTCLTVCPYSKPKTWWHRLATGSLHFSPVALRPVTVRALKWIDDRFWGTIANKRVRWLGYDSGVKPGETACTIPGCTATHGSPEGAPTTRVELSKKADRSKLGYYAPLKENTNRFTRKK